MLAALPVGGCAGPRENSVHRVGRGQQLGTLADARQRQVHERQLLEAAIAEDRIALQRLRDEAASAASRRRDLQRACDVEVAALQAETSELDQLRAAVAAAAPEVESLRAALADVQQRELRLQSLAEQRRGLDVQLSAAERELAQANEQLAPRLGALREQLDRAKVLEAQIVAALQQMAAGQAAAAAPVGAAAAGAPTGKDRAAPPASAPAK